MRKLAASEPDAAHLAQEAKPPEDSIVPKWAEMYLAAWQALRFDRQYGAFGGITPISFSAIDGYARRYDINGEEFETFRRFVTAVDDEYLEWWGEEEKKRQKKK